MRLSADRAVQLGFIALVLAAWSLAAHLAPPYLAPPLFSIGQDIWLILTQPGLQRHVLTTIMHILAAVGISIVVAFPLVILSHAFPALGRLIEDRLTPLVNAFPAIGWTLLGIVWFGLDSSTVIFTISAMLVPFNIINLAQGYRARNEDLLEMASSFTESRARRLAFIDLPLLAPFVFATLRLDFGVSWKVALTAELLGGNSGLGYLMNLSMQEQNTSRLLAVSLLIVAFAYLADVGLLAVIQNRFDARFRQS